MDMRIATDCNCDVKLPHTADQIKKNSKRTMPTYHYSEPENSEVWTHTETKRADQLIKAVDSEYIETTRLRDRVCCMEDEMKRQKGQALIHACAKAKRFQEALEPRRPESPNKEKEMIKELQRKLKKSRSDAVHNQNKIHNLKEELKIAKQLLNRELGIGCDDINLRELLNYKNAIGWKGRIQIIENLRTKVADLESSLYDTRRTMHQSSENRGPSMTFGASRNHIVPERQREAINKIYSDRTEEIRKLKEQIISLGEEMRESERIRKCTSARNITLTRELSDMTEKAKYYEAKSKRDKVLTDVLLKHQSVIKEMLQEQKKIGQFSEMRENEVNKLLKGSFKEKEKEDESADAISEQLEREMYKTLSKVNEETARNLENMVLELQIKLDAVTTQMVEAEKHCCDHKRILDQLQTQVTELKQSGKFSTKSVKVDYDNITSEYTKAISEENRLLRELLQNSVLSKADDFQTYKAIIESSRHEYLSSIQKISEIINPQEQKEDDEEEE